MTPGRTHGLGADRRPWEDVRRSPGSVAPVLSPRVVRTLEPLSAASGLVVVGARLYVVADDADELGVFPRQGGGPGRLLPGLARGAPPEDAEERKAWKADLEALVVLPGGGLLALGSGSTPARRGGVHWPAPEHGVAARPVELEPLHAVLDAQLPDLNLEGACVSGDHLVLAQRGNGADGADALVVCALAPVLEAIGAGEPVPAAALLAIHAVTGLGAAADGTPLALTDLAALPDGRLLATAVAERGASTYLDGACAGAAVAVLHPDGRVRSVHPLERPWKVEGILGAPRGDGTVDLLMCADPDDPAGVAPLLGATLRL